MNQDSPRKQKLELRAKKIITETRHGTHGAHTLTDRRALGERSKHAGEESGTATASRGGDKAARADFGALSVFFESRRRRRRRRAAEEREMVL